MQQGNAAAPSPAGPSSSSAALPAALLAATVSTLPWDPLIAALLIGIHSLFALPKKTFTVLLALGVLIVGRMVAAVLSRRGRGEAMNGRAPLGKAGAVGGLCIL